MIQLNVEKPRPPEKPLKRLAKLTPPSETPDADFFGGTPFEKAAATPSRSATAGYREDLLEVASTLEDYIALLKDPANKRDLTAALTHVRSALGRLGGA